MSERPAHPDDSRLSRELGLSDAVVLGLGAMVGAGIFASLGPAAAAAGKGLLIGLGLAAAVAFCNATSSAQLAALYPQSGGTYVYGWERLGHFWGWLAGWGFVSGKVASCAAMALTFGAYAAPGYQRPLALAAVAALTAVNYRGVRKSVALTRWILAVVLVALAVVVVAGVAGGASAVGGLGAPVGGLAGVMQSAGLLFFAFAGYARIATLGEEVVEPRRTIPRAIPLALGITLVIYATVAVAALAAVGPQTLARSSAPLAAVVSSGPFAALTPLVGTGAAVASLGVLLSLILGVSRTVFAMANQADLPRPLAAVHPRFKVPHRADLAVGLTVLTLVAVIDLRGAIGFSSFAVLAYYGIANASALTLSPAELRWPRWLAGAGLGGCAVLAVSLPLASTVAGTGVLGLGALIGLARQRLE